jgi:hypothetical protein
MMVFPVLRMPLLAIGSTAVTVDSTKLGGGSECGVVIYDVSAD